MDSRNGVKIVIALTLLFGWSSMLLANQSATQPNFIIIFADDLGYGDLGCYGHPTIKTPNLDRMAQEGMRLTQFYAAASVCSPSRAALLTGRLPKRTTINNVLFPDKKIGLPQAEITIAKALKQKEYATACIGKWHLGHTKEHLPTAHGFDSYYGIPYSNDMSVDPQMPVAKDVLFREAMTLEAMRSQAPKKGWVPLLRNEEVAEYPADQNTLTKRYTDEAIQFIRKNNAKPFFLYLAHTMPHVPLYATDEFRGKSLRGLYGDTIEEIDSHVGRLLAELKTQGLDETTMVIFSSDNGPWLGRGLAGGSAGLLRGGKGTAWEGGMREPCIVRWPQVIAAGTVNMGITSTMDVLPTILDFAGIKSPDDRVIDGYSLKEVLTKNSESPRQTMFYYSGGVLRAVRWKQWKLHMETSKSEQLGEFAKLEKPLLYDLQQDPGEQYDIANKHPDIITEMQEIIKKHVLTISESELQSITRRTGRKKIRE